MNKKLLLLLLAGATMFMLPACGDDDDDDNVTEKTQDSVEDDDEGNNQIADSSFALSEVYGSYLGDLTDVQSNSSFADSIGVTVGKDENADAVTLALDPITIAGFPIDNLSFAGIPCTYNAAEGTWNFSAKGLSVALMNGALNATVDINSGKFSKDGKLDFDLFVNAGLAQLSLRYSGNK